MKIVVAVNVRKYVTPLKTLLTMYHLLNVLQQKKVLRSEDISLAPHQI